MSARARNRRDKRAEADQFLSLSPAELDPAEAIDETELSEDEATEQPSRAAQRQEPNHD